MIFAESDIRNRVQTRNGALTGFLRARWRLRKVRSEIDRHHALDAVVIACATQAMVQRLMEYSRRGEVWAYDNPAAASYRSIDSHSGEEKRSYQAHRAHGWQFPLPWPDFRSDVDRCVEQVFVSRPPRRRLCGEAHAATIQSTKQAPDGCTVKRVALQNLNKKNIELILDREGRNRHLYEALKKRLEQYEWNAKKAFAEPSDKSETAQPFLHSDILERSGKEQIVRRVRIVESGASGVRIRGGLAGNSSILRTDVFRSVHWSGRYQYWLVPIYPHHRLAGRLPDRAIRAGKSEEEWQQIDDSFEFLFSLCIDDLVGVRRTKDNEPIIGYFKKTDRSNGTIAVEAADRSWSEPKRIGARNLVELTKYSVDLLGDYYRVGREKRLELAKPVNRHRGRSSARQGGTAL